MRNNNSENNYQGPRFAHNHNAEDGSEAQPVNWGRGFGPGMGRGRMGRGFGPGMGWGGRGEGFGPGMGRGRMGRQFWGYGSFGRGFGPGHGHGHGHGGWGQPGLDAMISGLEQWQARLEGRLGWVKQNLERLRAERARQQESNTQTPGATNVRYGTNSSDTDISML